VRMFHGAGEIHDRKQKENECLNQCHKNTQRHDRQRSKERTCQKEQNAQYQFMTHHVSEKTEGEGENSGKMADELDGQDDGNHPPDRAAEMFDVFNAMIFNADDVGEDDNRKCTGSRRVQAGRRRKEARQQSDQIAGEDIDENRGSQRQQPAAFFSGDIHHKFFNTGYKDFKEILSLRRNHTDALRSEHGKNDKERHDNPCIDDMGVGMSKMPQADGFE